MLDADALNAVAAEPGLVRALRARGGRDRLTVLTPHPLEAARLLGTDTAQVQGDRLEAARRLAEDLEVVVVLKGSGTVTAAPGGRLRLNPSGNARLATPGSGDVLAGWIGGAWARSAGAGGFDGVDAVDATADCAADAVWRHGRAAELADATHPARASLLAAELVDAMRDVPG